MLTRWLSVSWNPLSDSPRQWLESILTTSFAQCMWRKCAVFSETLTSTSTRAISNSRRCRKTSTLSKSNRDRWRITKLWLLPSQSNKNRESLARRPKSATRSTKNLLLWLLRSWRNSKETNRTMSNSTTSSTEWSRNLKLRILAAPASKSHSRPVKRSRMLFLTWSQRKTSSWSVRIPSWRTRDSSASISTSTCKTSISANEQMYLFDKNLMYTTVKILIC